MERIILKDGRSYDTIVRKSIIEDDGKRFLLNTRWDPVSYTHLQSRGRTMVPLWGRIPNRPVIPVPRIKLSSIVSMLSSW